MVQTILKIISISVLFAIPASMLVLSMKAGRAYIKELIGNPPVLIRYFLVMFVLMPSLALIFFFMDAGHKTIWMAVIVISLSPASPGMLKSITKLGGNIQLSTAWMITSIFIAFFMIPLNLFIIGKILNVKIDLGIDDVVLKLFVMFILPMFTGFIISKYLSSKVPVLIKVFDLISKIASVVLIIAVLIIAIPVIINKDMLDLLLILLFLIISLGISHFMESSDKEYRPVLSYSVVLRLPAPAILLAGINGKTKEYAPDIITYLLFGVILMVIYNKIFFGKKEIEKTG